MAKAALGNSLCIMLLQIHETLYSVAYCYNRLDLDVSVTQTVANAAASNRLRIMLLQIHNTLYSIACCHNRPVRFRETCEAKAVVSNRLGIMLLQMHKISQCCMLLQQT